MDQVSARCDRDKEQTMRDYKSRLIEKKVCLEEELRLIHNCIMHATRDRDRMIKSFWRWLPSRRKLIVGYELSIEEYEEKQALKQRLIAAIRQKLRAMP